jgi:hypothetical protein
MRRSCSPTSRSASGAFAQPGTLFGTGGRKPRLVGAARSEIISSPSCRVGLYQPSSGEHNPVGAIPPTSEPKAGVGTPHSARAAGRRCADALDLESTLDSTVRS